MNARIEYENKIWIERGEFDWDDPYPKQILTALYVKMKLTEASLRCTLW